MSEMETPWSRARKKRHERQEERIGNMDGGSKQANSGRFWRWKRDAILHDFLIEARTTEAGSYRIEGKEFQAIEKQAIQTPPGLLPGMQIDIGDLQLITIRLSDFQNFLLRLKKLEAQVEQEEEV
jgi:hypothetical protein